ncbi:MAG TPA: hypothetical protein VMV79_02225 [Alphaproteobacteria bacterium]|nr:hypothetical protein [Alphaproteobacteria bacterium]
MTELFLHAGPGSYRTMLAIVPGAIAEVIEGDTGQRPKVKPLFTAGSRADRPPHARRSRIRRYAIA